MRVFVILCLVAVAASFNLPDWRQRPGYCPPHHHISEVTLDAANRCQVDYDGELLDYSCDADGEETFKCCEYGEGVRICVRPTFVIPTTMPKVSPEPPELPPMNEEQVTKVVQKTKDFFQKLGKYPPPSPEYVRPQTPNRIRWCVSSRCEKTKCDRMAAEFTYSRDMTPKKQWSCVQADTPEQCMFWIERGWADIMTTRQKDVYTANTTFNLRPIAYETTVTQEQQQQQTISLKHYRNVTFALKLSSHTNPGNWAELRDKTTCHAGADMPASFEAPVLHLIKEGIVTATGDYVESFADFVQESCVPGILNKTYNKNGTYPKNLVSLCEGQENRYRGITGALSCLRSGKGQVTFVDHKVIKSIMEDGNERDNYMVVCREESRNLDEVALQDSSCHVGYTAQPAVYISKNNTERKQDDMKRLMGKAMEIYGATDPTTDFNIFDSKVYTCDVDPKTGAPTNRNLIFLQDSTNLKTIDDDSKVFAEKVYEAYTMDAKLTPKPRAKICVTDVTEYEACLRFKDVAEKFQETNKVAWGCKRTNSSMECMRAVHSNWADLYKADPVQTFTGGKDFKLDPLMSVHHNMSLTSTNHTYTHTLAVIKTSTLGRYPELLRVPEGEPIFIKDLWKLKICSAGIKNVSAFHNPIGWLLSNGTIPRIGTVFESIYRYFDKICVPGVEPEAWRWDKDLLLGHELNWGFPSIDMYNFTCEEWFTWNTPATWDYLTYNRKVTKGQMIEKILALITSNTTRNERLREHRLQPMTLLDDLLGVDGISTLKDTLKDTRREWTPTTGEEASDTHTDATTSRRVDTIIRDILSKTYPNFQGLKENRFTKKSTDIKQQHDKHQRRMNDIYDLLNIPFLEYPNEQLEMPLLAAAYRELMGQKAEAADSVEDILHHLKSIPTLRDFQGGEMNRMFEHPAFKSYLQTYFPRLADSYVNLFDNTELREREFDRYTNPLWLSPKLKTFLDVVEDYQQKITKTCEAARPLDFSGYKGSLRCLKSDMADVAFFDEQTLRDERLLDSVGFILNDFRLICPNGQVVKIDPDFEVAKVCNFGKVKNPALLVSYNTSGSWRWNVTRALMKTHESPAYLELFGDNTLMGRDYNKLLPIDPLRQTYQTYLGPMVLRSFEAIIKPSSYDSFKDNTNICYGETYTNVIKQRNDTCQAIIKDATCVGTPRMKKISVGRFGQKQFKIVKMCSRPSKFVRKMAEFTCNNGYGYLQPVVTAVACECVPCEESIEFRAPFTDDAMWKNVANKYTPAPTTFPDPYRNVTIWGNKPYWYDHTANKNFELGNKTVTIRPIVEVIQEAVRGRQTGVLSQLPDAAEASEALQDVEERTLLGTPTVQKTCEAVWLGRHWNKEWFLRAHDANYPRTTGGTCVAPLPGQRVKSRLERYRQALRKDRFQ